MMVWPLSHKQYKKDKNDQGTFLEKMGIEYPTRPTGLLKMNMLCYANDCIALCITGQ